MIFRRVKFRYIFFFISSGFETVNNDFLSDILGNAEETVLTDNIIHAAASTAGVPDTPSTSTSTAVSQVARIQPIQHPDESSSSAYSEDSSEETVDSSMEIHLFGDGKNFIYFRMIFRM